MLENCRLFCNQKTYDKIVELVGFEPKVIEICNYLPDNQIIKVLEEQLYDLNLFR